MKQFFSLKNKKFLDFFIYSATALLVCWIFFLCVAGPQFTFDIPLRYTDADELSFLAIAKMVAQKQWIPFTNLFSPYLGAPGSLDMGDFPLTDYAHLILMKIISFFSQSPAFIYNTFYLITFILVAWTSAFTLRKFRISRFFAFPLGIIYAFMPYHFHRYPQLFLCGYYMLPLMTLLLIGTCSHKPLFFKYHKLKKKMQWDFTSKKALFAIMTLMIAGGCGTDYCFFFLWLMVGAGISAWVYRKSRYHFYSSLIACGMCASFVFLGNFSYVYYRIENGSNPEVAQRNHTESEQAALKLSHMILPQSNHRIKIFSIMKKKYRPIIRCEGLDDSLGIISGLSFILLLGFFLFKQSQLNLPRRLGNLTVIGILYASTGGFSVLFALLVDPSIRWHNRISIFIAFFVIVAIGSFLQSLLQKGKLNRKAPIITLASLFVFCIYDQTTPYPSISQNKLNYESDASFIHQIEALYPQSKILQLPYTSFPEKSYTHLRGFIHAQNLYWSFGSMHGRSADLEYNKLSTKPISLKSIQDAGFNGIWIYRNMYKNDDNALNSQSSEEELEKQLRFELGIVPMTNRDNSLAYYPLKSNKTQEKP